MPGKITIEKLIDFLNTKGSILTSEEMNILTEKDISASPWYIKIFIGLSAWIASIFLLLFLILFILLTSIQSKNLFMLLFFGIAICGTAVAINRSQVKTIFMDQFAISLSIAGQGLIAAWAGFMEIARYNPIPAITITIIIMEIFLIFGFKNSIHRFLSMLAVICALQLFLFYMILFHSIYIILIIVAVTAYMMWIYEPTLAIGTFSEIYGPLGYASVITLLSIPLLSILHDPFHGFDLIKLDNIIKLTWWPLTSSIGFVMLFLENKILNDMQLSSKSILKIIIMLITLAFAGITYNSPGIIISLFIFTLGFYRSNKVVMGLASLFLCIYCSAFYYHLQISLLEKSIVLMSSGLLLILIRFLLKTFIFHERKLTSYEK